LSLQSGIYHYLVNRQRATRLQRQLKSPSRSAFATKSQNEQENPKKSKMNQPGNSSGEGVSNLLSGFGNRLGSAWYGQARQPGQTRQKLKGYISTIKENYQQNYAGTFQGIDDFGQGLSEAYPDANIARGGGQEMILFPCYAKHHIEEKAGSRSQDPNATEEQVPGTENNGQAIQQHWDQHEDENAIVDVDVRGWIYSPHKGAMTRKQRLALGIARQLSGLPTILPNSSPKGSRDSSPHPIRDALQDHSDRKEQQLIDFETDHILAKAKSEAAKADRGEYSENYGSVRPSRVDSLQRMTSSGSTSSVDSTTMAQRRATWAMPSEMSPEQAELAHTNLMNRLRPFYANPAANNAVSAFFYNETESRMRTIYTNEYGTFALRASLDFIPTHVRILAGEDLSTTQELKISDAPGICVISDIDDTIKHTGMLNGAREAFRNAFLRNTEDLVIDGVQSWYTTLADKGVSFHYVSNSPWQLFPALTNFFAAVGLPAGSIHLKQYTGIYQGIFEPVAERKKSTLDRIARDFPERYFLLIGDSGEADLEVYVDFVRDNPGRVLGVFIRDITTPNKPGYFDPNSGPRFAPVVSSQPGSPKLAAVDSNHDPELKAAIDASVKEFEAEEQRRGGTSSAPRIRTNNDKSEDLISFSDDEDAKPTQPAKRAPPPLPKKPEILRGPSAGQPPPIPLRTKPVPQSARSNQAPTSPAHRFSVPDIETPDLNRPALPPRRAQTATSAAPLSGTQPPPAAQSFTSTLTSHLPNLPTLGGTSNEKSPPLSPTLASGLTRSQVNRLELWRRRWITASEVLRKEGVVLRAWRVGDDAVESSLGLVEKAKKLREMSN
jgi:phosphatidate phosphatase APP1